jgi:hypothetical protein
MFGKLYQAQEVQSYTDTFSTKVSTPIDGIRYFFSEDVVDFKILLVVLAKQGSATA